MKTQLINLKSAYDTFISYVTEMESSLMFPTILKDLSLSQMHNLKMFDGKIHDCHDLFQEVVAIKEDLSRDCSSRIYICSEREITSKFLRSSDILVKATHLARLVRIKYTSLLGETLNNQSFSYSDNFDNRLREKVQEHLNFTEIVDKFVDEMKELENIILIPSILYGVYDNKITSYVEKHDIGICDSSLAEVFDFLKHIRTYLTEVIHNKSKCKSSYLSEFHNDLSDLLQACLWLMQKYHDELSLKAGTDKERNTSCKLINTSEQYPFLSWNFAFQRVQYSC